MRILIGPTAAAVMIAAATTAATTQKDPAADIAKQMSGTWTINLGLSHAVSPGRSNGGRSGGGARYAIAGTAFQRGGGGGGGGGDASSDLTPEEMAERTAMRQIQQIAAKITIAASAESFSITDDRGTQTCAANGKSEKTQMFNVSMGVKCRWDKDRLRQEFSTTRSKLIRTWALDDAGRLLLKGKLEGIGQNTPEATAVFDRADR